MQVRMNSIMDGFYAELIEKKNRLDVNVIAHHYRVGEKCIWYSLARH